jgi:PhzF family phenazine biosynthesis protein
MSPDFQMLKQLLLQRNLTSVCVFTTETKHPTSAAHSRFFAPAVGIDEDPVTGLAQGELACYLFKHNRLPQSDSVISVALEQGYIINRGGRGCGRNFVIKNGVIESVSISGYAVTVMNGKMLV